MTSSRSLPSFKSKLKTHLFKFSFPHSWLCKVTEVLLHYPLKTLYHIIISYQWHVRVITDVQVMTRTGTQILVYLQAASTKHPSAWPSLTTWWTTVPLAHANHLPIYTLSLLIMSYAPTTVSQFSIYLLVMLAEMVLMSSPSEDRRLSGNKAHFHLVVTCAYNDDCRYLVATVTTRRIRLRSWCVMQRSTRYEVLPYHSKLIGLQSLL